MEMEIEFRYRNRDYFCDFFLLFIHFCMSLVKTNKMKLNIIRYNVNRRGLVGSELASKDIHV